jgi:hypothetical protein
MTQSADAIQLEIENHGPPVNSDFDPQLPLGAQLQGAEISAGSLEVRPIAATLRQNQQDTHAHVNLTVPEGRISLTVRFTGGVAIINTPPQPEIGEPSRALRVTAVSLHDGQLTLGITAAAAQSSSLDLRTPWKIQSIEGAQFAASGPSTYHVTIPPLAGTGQISVKFADGVAIR